MKDENLFCACDFGTFKGDEEIEDFMVVTKVICTKLRKIKKRKMYIYIHSKQYLYGYFESRFQCCWTKPQGEETPGFNPIQQGRFENFGGPKSNNIGQNHKNKKIPLGETTRKLAGKSRITLDITLLSNDIGEFFSKTRRKMLLQDTTLMMIWNILRGTCQEVRRTQKINLRVSTKLYVTNDKIFDLETNIFLCQI